MTFTEIKIGLITSILGSIIATAIGFFISYLNRKLTDFKFRKKFRSFFGSAKYYEGAISFVLDHYNDAIRHNTINMGSSNTYIVSYLSPIIERFTKKPTNIILHSEFKSKWNNCDQSLILTGSPSTNHITGILLKNNGKVSFEGRQDNAEMISISNENDKKLNYRINNGHYGILMKIRNKFSKSHNFLILAGLTNESTSAAGYLLRKKWEDIVQQIDNEEFTIVFKVEIPGQDDSTEIIYTSPSLNLN